MARAGVAYVDVLPRFDAMNKQLLTQFSGSKWKKAGAAAGAGIAAGAAGAAVGLYKIGEAFDDASDTIRVGTGKTGKHLKRLENDFKAVVQDVPADFATASSAIADLNKRLDVTGKPLRRLSKQFLELSRLTKTDVGENVASVSRAFKDWEVQTGRQSGQLNKFFRASQASGSSVAELARQVVQFGAPLRQVGFNLDEATALFAQFEKAGVNTQTMMPGLRMALKSFLSEGVDPQKGLAKAFADIESGAMTSSEALKLFGQRAGADMLEAIKQGRFDLDKLTASMQKNRETIGKASKDTQDFDEQWQKFKNRTMVALEPTAKKVFTAVSKEAGKMFDDLNNPKLTTDEKIERITKRMGDLFEKAAPELADRAADVAPVAARAFVNAFADSNAWGKVATLGFIGWKTGAIKGLGKQAAKWFATQFGLTAGATVAAETAVGGQIGGALGGPKTEKKWRGLGRIPGKWIGRGLVAGVVLGLIEYGAEIKTEIDRIAEDIEDWIEDAVTLDFSINLHNPLEDTKSVGPGGADDYFDNKGRSQKKRAGGVIQKLRAGGFAQAMVSPGELLAFPGGGAAVVPGPRMAADSVHATLPVGTAVFTGHGQQLLASGASAGEALRKQLPHFRDGGKLSAGQMSGLAAWAGIPKGHQTRMGAIGFRESRGQRTARNYNPPIEDSRGLWQINVLAHKWARNWNLYDPETNAKAMRQVYARANAAWGDPLNPWKPVSTSDPFLGRARNIVTWGDRAEGGGGGSWPRKVTAWGRQRMQRGIYGSAFSDAFDAAREGRGLRGVRSEIFGAVRDAVPDRRKKSGFDPSMPSGGGAGKFTPGGGWAGTQGLVMQALKGLTAGQSMTFKRSTAVNGNQNSDHNTWIKNAFAADISPGGSPLFDRLKKRLGIPARMGSWNQFTNKPIKGFRTQLLWHAPDGTHQDHVHLGIRKMRGGGVLAGPPNLPGVGTQDRTKARTMLTSYARGLDEFSFARLRDHITFWRATIREMFKGGVTRHEAAAIGRMRGAISMINAEAGQRAGRLARRADQLGGLAERRSFNADIFMRTAGLDPSSVQGLHATRYALRDQLGLQRGQRGQLRKAFNIAKQAGATGTARAIRDEIRALDDAIIETITQRTENARNLIAAKVQAETDRVQAFLDSALAKTELTGTNLGLLQSWQDLQGTSSTDAGRNQQIGFLKQQIIPGLEKYVSTLKWEWAAAMGRGDKTGAANIWNQILGVNQQLLQANLDIKALTEDIAAAATERLSLYSDTASLGLSNLELNQRVAGTFDTSAGREARAAFITSTVVPALKAMLADVATRWQTALGTPDPNDEIVLWNQGIGIQNSILQATIDANELLAVIADNSQDLQQLLDLQKAETFDWQRRYNVSQAQYGVLRGFAAGGVVPGPVGGASASAISQSSTQGSNVRVVVEDHRIRVLVDDVEQIVENKQRRDGRRAERLLPGSGARV